MKKKDFSKNKILEETNIFLEFESSFIKKDIKIKNYNMWALLRVGVCERIFSSLNISLGTNKENKFKNKKRRKSILLNLQLLFKDLFSLVYLINNSDVLLINNNYRIINIEEEITNSHLWSMMEPLRDDFKIKVLDTQSKSLNLKKTSVVSISSIVSIMVRISGFLYYMDLRWKKFEITADKLIYEKYKVNLDWKEIYKNSYKRQIYISFFVKIIFFTSKPKILYFTDNGLMSSSIKVAKDYKIPTIDYQHGLLSEYYVIYNHNKFVSESYKEFLSDYYMAWGNYRLKGYENFYKTLVGGNPFFEYQKKKYSDVKKDLKSILLVSDGHLTRQDLQELASYLSSNLQNYKIYYKLRPEEYDNFKLLYKEILNENKNLNIINSDDPGLYYFLKKSNYVIGTNSTVLIEALPLSNVIIYEKGWFFEMEDYVNNELMFSFKTKENILDFILNGNADDINPNVEIFAENSISSMNQITKNIISKRK